MKLMHEPCEANGFHLDHVSLLLYSYRSLTGRNLVADQLNAMDAAKHLFSAPFAVVSHDTSPDPIFNYANQIALKLFEMSWEEFTALPSRRSAETPNQQERSRQLEMVKKNGFIENYSGVRISKNGNRFIIEDAIVWNLIDSHGTYRGQAATFEKWRPI